MDAVTNSLTVIRQKKLRSTSSLQAFHARDETENVETSFDFAVAIGVSEFMLCLFVMWQWKTVKKTMQCSSDWFRIM